MKVLLCTDGFPSSEAALEVVLYRPWEEGTEVRVITVIPPLHDLLNRVVGILGVDNMARKAHAQLAEDSKTGLAKYVERLGKKFGADRVSSSLLEGRPGDKIVAEAKSWNADSIVIGAHGRNDTGDFLFGSVPEYVLGHAPCPVEILRATTLGALVSEIERDEPVEENKYLIALDDSHSSHDVMEEVLSRKWPATAHFRTIMAIEPLPFHAYSGLGPWEGTGNEEFAELVRKTVGAEKEAARQILDNAVARLKRAFPEADVSSEMVEGYAKDRLLSYAREWPADLIIMGSHGRRGFVEFVLGSVSKATALHAPCSVFVVRNPHLKPTPAGTTAGTTGAS
jgi:nucleotide-binding universal stress UspA family protein